MHVGIFYLEHVKVIWVIQCTFPKIGQYPVTQKQLLVERNGRKLGSFSVKRGSDSITAHHRVKHIKNLGCVCCMHMDTFNLEHFKVIWGHSKLARNSKTAHHRRKWTKIRHLGNICSSNMGTI